MLLFDKPMSQGVLLARYKRFLADVDLGQLGQWTVHCPNSGSMKTCCQAGQPVVVSDSENPSRKLRHTWEMIRMGRTWVGVHSARSNKIVKHFALKGKIPELAGYSEHRAEVVYGPDKRSRVDLLFSADNRRSCYVEIKHCSMRVGKDAAFPDARTERGQKHLRDLVYTLQQGHRAVIFYLVGRNDCTRFRPADEIDPEYGRLLRWAAEQGVEVLAYRAQFSPRGVRLSKRLPIVLDPK